MRQHSTVPMLYNPAYLSKDDLIRRFVIRLGEFRLILHDLEKTDPSKPTQHFLIQGMRGTGKTTLLLRVAYEIQSNPELAKSLLPIQFNEEQYRIRKLSRLWEAILEYLADQDPKAAAVYAHLIKLKQPGDKALEMLLAYLQEQGKQAVLFLDNLGDLLERIGTREEQRLRELLLCRGELRLIASNTTNIEGSDGYQAPFFDFFKVIQLKGLNKQDTERLLLSLSDSQRKAHVRHMVENEPYHVEIMRRLTGGLPRTTALLFEVFADRETEDLVQHLEYYLDRTTVLYKQRMDALTPQHQDIVDALASAWDAVPVREIAARVELPSGQVSAQLKQLIDNGLVTLVRTEGRNHLYRLSERFFNIWYLMRCARRKDQKKVIWLIRFLQTWCSPSQLEDRAAQHLKTLANRNINPRHAFYMTEALVHAGGLTPGLEHNLILATRNMLRRTDPSMLAELSASDMELVESAKAHIAKGEIKTALENLEQTHQKSSHISWCMGLSHAVVQEWEMAITHLEAANTAGSEDEIRLHLAYCYNRAGRREQGFRQLQHAAANRNTEAMFQMGVFFEDELEFEWAHDYYRDASEAGHLGATLNLGLLLWNRGPFKNPTKAKALLKKAAAETLDAQLNLAFLLLGDQEYEEAFHAMADALNQPMTQEQILLVGRYLELLMVREMYHAAFKLFQTGSNGLVEALKSIYYALLFFLKGPHDKAYVRMGPELKETVEEIVSWVQDTRKEIAEMEGGVEHE